MPLTSTERQRKLRKAREDDGLKEVRGLWLPPEQHKDIKEIVRGMGQGVRLGDVVRHGYESSELLSTVAAINGDKLELNSYGFDFGLEVNSSDVLEVYKRVE